MIIEIRKASFINKGAELMLLTIISKLKERYPRAKFVMATNMKDAPYEKRALYGFFQKFDYWRKRIQFGKIINFIPKNIRDSLGLVLDSEIDVVIDAAGFAYGDQWGYRNCIELHHSCKSWKRYGAKVILLPQAFGPFKNKKSKKNMSKAIEKIDLIFAREQDSYNNLIEITSPDNKINIKPDFTNLTSGVVPGWFEQIKGRICIIPNYRMIDKTNIDSASHYIKFIVKSINHLIKSGFYPFILIHGGNEDLKLANEINVLLDKKIPIIEEDCALKIKGIIGSCHAMIGSRFHGLVSAMSQGVPALGTSWSHKYKMLFDDYHYPEGLVDMNITDKELLEKIDILIDPYKYNYIKNHLNNRSNLLKKQTEEMWEMVFEVIEN